MAHGDELDDAINSTYELVAGNLLDIDKLAKKIERRASQGFTDSLAAIISRAAKATLQREIDREKRDSVIVDNIATTTDGETLDLLGTVAAKDNTDGSTIIRVTLKDFFAGLDAKNKIIFGGMVQGKTEREIAPAVEISNIAVHNRMVKIRAQLAALL